MIGVCVVGAGGGGALISGSKSSTYYIVSGGASGYVENATVLIKPGQSCNLVVGAGGNGISTNSTDAVYTDGNNGGSSSFLNITAIGGDGGRINPASDGKYSNGSDYSGSSNGHFGGRETVYLHALYGDSSKACNLFTNTRIVGSGSGAYDKPSRITDTTIIKAELDPITKLGGGDCVVTNSSNNKPGNATLNGCGGGSLLASVVNKNPSGTGGDGLVIIYLIGGSF